MRGTGTGTLAVAAFAFTVGVLGGLFGARPAAGDPALPEPSPPAPVQALMTAGQLATAAAAGKPVSLNDVAVQGDLNLGTTTLANVFRCERCRFTGAFNANDAIFSRVVDLTGSTFEGLAEARGAEFKGDLLLTDAHFTQAAYFNQAAVAGAAEFERVIFTANTSFSGTGFASSADFVSASFRSAADFSNAHFAAACHFGHAEFHGVATFKGAGVHGEGNFRSLIFDSTADFDGVSAEAPLHFDGSFFKGNANLTNLTSGMSMTLQDLLFGPKGQVYMDQLAVHDLSMPVASVRAVRGFLVQQKVLSLIETSAQSHGDLATANDARFLLLTLEGRDKVGFRRLVDSVFYRTVGGYLVRAEHPLATFALLLGVAGVTRSLPRQREILDTWRRGRARNDGTRLRAVLVQWPHRALLGLQKVVTAALRGLAAALTAAFRTKANIDIGDPEKARSYFVAAVRWSEFLAYKVLIAVFLLSLGNSNATIRQILDSIRH